MIHFEDDVEELQQWDQQVFYLSLPLFVSLEQLYMIVCFIGVEYDWKVESVQISGLCQALNDILDGMAKKGMSVPVWLTPKPWDRLMMINLY